MTEKLLYGICGAAMVGVVLGCAYGIGRVDGRQEQAEACTSQIAEMNKAAEQAIAEAESAAKEREDEINRRMQVKLAEAKRAASRVSNLRSAGERLRQQSEDRANRESSLSGASSGSCRDCTARLARCERLLGEGAELVGQGAELSVRVAGEKDALLEAVR